MTVEFTKSKPKSLTSNASWSTILTVWQAVITFVLTPLFVAKLGTSHYGLFVLLMTVSGFMGIMNLGLGDATLRYVAYYYGKNDLVGVNRVVGATFSVYVFAGVLAWALLFFGAKTITGWLSIAPDEFALTVTLLRLTSISVGLGLIFSAYSSICQALQRYDINARVQIAISLFNVIGTVVILINWPGIYELVVWSVITAVFTQALNVAVARKLIPRIRLWPSPGRQGLKEVFGYGIFSFITHILGLVWGQADRLILGSLVSPAAVAYLSVPQQLSMRGSMAVGSAGGALFPRFSVIVEKVERSRLFLDATWIFLCATIILFVPLAALFPDFLRLWINPEFSEKSAWIAQVVAFSCIVRGAFVPYDALFRGVGKPQFLTAVFFATGITSLVTNLFLIPRFGLSGAGYAYLATTLWGVVAIGFAWKRVLGETSLRPLLRVVVVPIALGYVILLIMVLLRLGWFELGWIGLISFGVLGSVFTATVLFSVEAILGGNSSRITILLNILLRWRAIKRSPCEPVKM